MNKSDIGDINKLISLHDETLIELKNNWMKENKSGNTETTSKAMDRIDRALDYRIKLMNVRDKTYSSSKFNNQIGIA